MILEPSFLILLIYPFLFSSSQQQTLGSCQSFPHGHAANYLSSGGHGAALQQVCSNWDA